MNRINIITLGVKDVQKSLLFYRDGLGFITPSTEEQPAIVFFNNGGSKLALYPYDELLKDTGLPAAARASEGFCGITLAYNAKTKEEVDDIFAKVESLGGRVTKAPEKVFWGGYSGYFQDLDGYLWEVAYADFWQFDDRDMLIITE
jgi:catechol 2,3-dioxygenase-like lactoylglutathione lyase family enzyme